MALMLFLQWWYKQGWINAFLRVEQRIKFVSQELSLSILASTLFEPWKQIRTYSGSNIAVGQKIRILFDNIFSRIVGFVVRALTILFGLVIIAILAVIGFIFALVWPIIPVLPVVLIVVGLL